MAVPQCGKNENDPARCRRALVFYLGLLQHFQIADPHDRIYSTLGSMSICELPVDLALDYERHAQDMFHRCAVFILGEIGYIDIIQAHCGHTEGMPPWLPGRAAGVGGMPPGQSHRS